MFDVVFFLNGIDIFLRVLVLVRFVGQIRSGEITVKKTVGGPGLVSGHRYKFEYDAILPRIEVGIQVSSATISIELIEINDS